MALSDCVNCWETPCVCGHDYKDWSEEKIEKQIEMLENVLKSKQGWTPVYEKYPDRGKEVVLLDDEGLEHHVYLSHIGREWRSVFGGGLMVNGKYWKYKFDKDKE